MPIIMNFINIVYLVSNLIVNKKSSKGEEILVKMNNIIMYCGHLIIITIGIIIYSTINFVSIFLFYFSNFFYIAFKSELETRKKIILIGKWTVYGIFLILYNLIKDYYSFVK